MGLKRLCGADLCTAPAGTASMTRLGRGARSSPSRSVHISMSQPLAEPKTSCWVGSHTYQATRSTLWLRSCRHDRSSSPGSIRASLPPAGPT